MASASSPTIYRTTTQDDGTKKRTAYRVNVDYSTDTNGTPTGFETQLQNDLTAIDGGITGGGINATWTTGAKLSKGNIWERQYRDSADTTQGWVTPDEGWLELNDRKSNFQSQVNDAAATALAKRFNGAGYGRTFGMDTKAGAAAKLSEYLGTNKLGFSAEANIGSGSGGMRQTSMEEALEGKKGTRNSYSKHLYYPVALRNHRGQDRLKISVLKYSPRKQGKDSAAYKLGPRQSFTQRVIGSCVLPVPGGVGDQNSVSWGENTMNPVELAIAGATFDALTSATPGQTLAKNLGDTAKAAMTGSDAKGVKMGLAAVFTKAATGMNSKIMTRRTGAIVNPNMELLFDKPTLRPFAFNFKMSPRSREESYMVKRIIRMFKQSMAAQRTESNLFLKSPNTYKLQWLSEHGNSEHEFLPRVKECALQGFNVNYTPDGNYATYEDTSMVSYDVQFSFTELEPLYNDDDATIDGNNDNSIGY